jgi:hypothetical protein
VLHLVGKIIQSFCQLAALVTDLAHGIAELGKCLLDELALRNMLSRDNRIGCL